MRLREARKKARLSQQQVADYIGISQNTYSYWDYLPHLISTLS